MSDGVLINQAATIERGVKPASDPPPLPPHSRDRMPLIRNIERVCVAALDMGYHLIRCERLGVLKSARDVFTLLA